MHILGMMV